MSNTAAPWKLWDVYKSSNWINRCYYRLLLLLLGSDSIEAEEGAADAVVSVSGASIEFSLLPPRSICSRRSTATSAPSSPHPHNIATPSNCNLRGSKQMTPPSTISLLENDCGELLM
eukprot:CAMPEP_0201982188 /NCGR_PEP_ID=MMETSP0904-20121228/75960_1 /ASSEMBLY_ACC=CAM_ASM_000553 /TAXON_ID=420261 /ORGANISM="Thalassiosira antarctica, Strain CCMP982" /LENGTH=116 /DNA_ID=CAMNT_0048534933 /DNA_START=1242 /DNA_END=1592 /DNA_ORIENTATION=-